MFKILMIKYQEVFLFKYKNYLATYQINDNSFKKPDF